mmetsp:Transcript_103157/g.189374  ORF Transcript_103157/g.189374 Transcript_103157/m.189374 type:complete len:796 (+) Transcript_103157:53-2440(+)
MTASRAASLAVWLPLLLPILAAAQAADAPTDADAVLEELAKVTQLKDAGSIRALMARARKAEVALEALRPAVEHLQSLELESMPEEVRFDKASEEYGRDHCKKKEVVVAPECRLDDEQLASRSQMVGEENCNHFSLRPGGDPTSHVSERSSLFCKFPPEFDVDRMSGALGAPRPFEWSDEFDKILNKSFAAESAVLNVNLPMYKAVIEPCEHNDIWFIMFYQHWCPHCQGFMPKLYKFALAARDAGARLRFAGVNCGDAHTMCEYFQIKLHPMITFVYHGKDIRVHSILQTFQHNPPTEMVDFMSEEFKIDVPKWLFPHVYAAHLIKQLPEEYRPPPHVIDHISVDDHSAMFADKDKPKSSCPTARQDKVHLASLSGRELPKQEDARKLALSLTPKTFAETVKEKGNVAILFTGNETKCKTCPLALPVWNNAKRKLDDITFAVIDGFIDEKFPKRFFKRGEVILPSILYFDYAKCKLKKCKEYMGPLYAGAAPEKQFHDWLLNHAGAKMKATEEIEELGIFIGNGWQLPEFGFKAVHRFHEAAQAIVYMLDEWVVPDVSSRSPNGFTLAQLNDIHAWISLLVATFPSVGNFSLAAPLRSLKDTVAQRVQDVRAAKGKMTMCAEEWRELMTPIREHFMTSRENQTLKPACFTETCRVWTLLHIITISDFARKRTTTSVGENKIVFATITEFLRRFFTCATCRRHFLDAITLGSVNLAQAMSGGPRELALWWWRMHNDVSQRVKHEGRCRGDRQWPPIDLCQVCWQDTSGQKVIDEDAIAKELVTQYWPEDAVVLEA